MALIGLERRFMESPFKRILQRFLEFRIFQKFLKKHGCELTGSNILEAGCGVGYGLELIGKEFHPSKLVGFDIDPKMVQLARQRGLNSLVYVDDITQIHQPSETFDAVFAFTVLHHVIAWRQALREIHRVLKPRGLFLANELHKKTLDCLERFLGVTHPRNSRFHWSDLRKQLISIGFKIIEEYHLLNSIVFFLCLKETHL